MARDFGKGTIYGTTTWWNVELTNEELAALNQGYSPLLIRPDRLIRYTPPTWHHCSAVFASDAERLLYLDGEYVKLSVWAKIRRYIRRLLTKEEHHG